MVRITIKGGVWKNTEDEILKAAVMKYGKNQWARISSLLVRKTAKQCKARWYEWLDPSIKKTEWTRGEEEKLLHLAKIMPTQWRTIAPIIGRTAAQCLEHYEKLLDAAQQKDEGEFDPLDDPRRLRPGEIDPAPETKPAKPDPVDMDEDEKEMLSEARARLANTKGKKAKRKAREKQLEEAKRLAALQKKRELRAAGINMVNKRRRIRKGVDYLNEVPFEKKAPKGFFDTTEEFLDGRQQGKDASFIGKTLRELEGGRRDADEEKARKKDKKRLEFFKKTNLPEALIKINQLNDPAMIKRRTQLSLPSPQLSDQELEDYAKSGNAAAVAASGGGATATLLANYSQTPQRGATPARTPRTPVQRDSILEETQNLIALTKSQTPLAGGENAPLFASDFSGATPKRLKTGTPGTALTAATPGRTPRSQRPQTPGTPGGARDALGLNEGSSGFTAEEVMHAHKSRRAEKKRLDVIRQKLAQGLKNLAEPTMEYGLVMPTLPADEASKEEPIEEDAEDAMVRLKAEEKARKDALLRKRSQVLQRDLPRPAEVNNEMQPELNRGKIGELIRDEMLLMVKFDAVKHPKAGGKGVKRKRAPEIESFSEDQINRAREMVEQELGDNVKAAVKDAYPELTKEWQALTADIAFLPSNKSFGFLSKVPEAERKLALQQSFILLQQQLESDLEKANKLEKKTGLLLGGYMKKTQESNKSIANQHQKFSQANVELRCFEGLLQRETEAIPVRVENLKREVEAAERVERELQSRYSTLMAEKARLTRVLSAPA